MYPLLTVEEVIRPVVKSLPDPVGAPISQPTQGQHIKAGPTLLDRMQIVLRILLVQGTQCRQELEPTIAEELLAGLPAAVGTILCLMVIGLLRGLLAPPLEGATVIQGLTPRPIILDPLETGLQGAFLQAVVLQALGHSRHLDQEVVAVAVLDRVDVLHQVAEVEINH